jgi:Predicted metal-dependent RNase, consists of a metallo-beta-lactamase domain and an RNA-binding KH domain
MTFEKTLDDLLGKIRGRVGDAVELTGIEYEGTELVIYTSDPAAFVENENIIRNLAKDLKKRIVVRPDKKALTGPESAIKGMENVIPKDSGVKTFTSIPRWERLQ